MWVLRTELRPSSLEARPLLLSYFKVPSLRFIDLKLGREGPQWDPWLVPQTEGDRGLGKCSLYVTFSFVKQLRVKAKEAV